jgi:GNAT superfamily N-acetyltransferase
MPRRYSWRRLATFLRQALGYVRRHGLRQTVGRFRVRFIYGSQDFIITRVALSGPPVHDKLGEVTLRLATPSDLPHLDELERYDRRASVIRGHVEDGNWLFIACHGDRIVAARITSPAIPTHAITAKALRLGPEQAWDEDMFCVPDYRGKGIARHLSLFSDRYMASLGYTEAFASISTWNIPSLRMQLHKGSEFAYHVSYRRFLIYDRLSVSPHRPPGRPGSDIIALFPSWRGPARSDVG